MQSTRLIAVFSCAIALLAGCSSNSSGTPAVRTASGVDASVGAKPVSRFTSATILRRLDSAGTATNDHLTVKDPDELVALESFFPQVGTNQRGSGAGAWAPSVIIQFKPAQGRSIRVLTNYQVWSEGLGDWPVNPAFGDHLDRLFAHSAP